MPGCRECPSFSRRRLICNKKRGSPIRKCVNTLLDQLRPTFKEKKVLEIGCGVNRTTRSIIQESGGHWFGIDPRSSRRVNATHIGKAEEMPFFENEEFDIIIASQTMEHWENTEALERGLKEMYRVLKPGGYLNVDVPIHSHGHRYFIRGELDNIKALFNLVPWGKLLLEEWRHNYEPLEPYKAWKEKWTKVIKESSRQETPSVWILQIMGVKPLENEK